MRISVDPADRGFMPDLGKRRLMKVKLNGEEVKYCITADDELNLVVVHMQDEQGNLVLTADRSEIKQVTRFGKVEIEEMKE